MRYEDKKLKRKNSLVEGEKEKKKEENGGARVGLCVSVFLSLNTVPYSSCHFR